jgi:hypothetical protein
MKAISVMGGAALVVSLACSGRYEVGGGGLDGASGSEVPTSGATASGSGGGANFAGATAQGGGVSASGTGTGGKVDDEGSTNGGLPAVEDGCETPTAPTPLTGALAEPAVVWERITRLIEGEGAPPPSKLPTRTTYAWAGQLVTQAFVRARRQGDAPGARALVKYWLFRGATPPEQPLEVDWGASLLEVQPAFDQLMLVPVGEHGYGVFSEPAWLVHASSISARGARIYDRVVGAGPPPAPQMVSQTTTPDPTLTRREELSVAIANPVCAACHAVFDDLGYAYDNFDELGEYEELDDGKPVDTSGRFPPMLGMEQTFMNVQQLGEGLAESCVARRRFVVTFARAALELEGPPAEAQISLVDQERIAQAFSFSDGRTYEDFVRAYAQSPLVLQR